MLQARVSDLNRVYRDLDNATLSNSNNDVDEYITTFRGVVSDINNWAKVKLEEHYIIYKFLSNLGPAFSPYASNYAANQDALDTQKYTLDTCIMDFSIEHQVWLSRAQDSGTNKILVYEPTISTNAIPDYRCVPHCTFCQKNNHVRDECRDLHPHLRRSGVTKRGSRDAKRPLGRVSKKKKSSSKRQRRQIKEEDSDLTELASA